MSRALFKIDSFWKIKNCDKINGERIIYVREREREKDSSILKYKIKIENGTLLIKSL